MNPLHPSLSQASPRRVCTRPASGWCLAVSGVLLLTVGAVAAAPSPTPKATAKPSLTPAATPVATPAMTPAATASPSASATVSPTPEVKATYGGQQQMQYIATARDAFLAERQAQSQPFLDATAALEAAGGFNLKGLSTKEAVAARRDLVAKSIAANEMYLNFVKTQVDTYRAELAKTPLVPNDVDTIAAEFAVHANTDAIVKLHENERNALKTGDDMLAYLDKTFGSWSVTGAGVVMFKKKSGMATYAELAQKYNTLAKAGLAMREQINTTNAVPSASAPPAAVPGATASPAASASPTASASPSASASPTPSAKPTATAKPTH